MHRDAIPTVQGPNPNWGRLGIAEVSILVAEWYRLTVRTRRCISVRDFFFKKKNSSTNPYNNREHAGFSPITSKPQGAPGPENLFFEFMPPGPPFFVLVSLS